MTVSCKTYLVRAVHQWCCDQGFTPYLRVFVDDQVLVPPGYAQSGEITLNLSYEATQALKIGDEAIEFRARFNGIARDVYVPITHVLAIFAHENMEGLGFGPPNVPKSSEPSEAAEQAGEGGEASPLTAEGTEAAETADGATDEDNRAGEGDTPPPRPKGRPRLTLIK